MTETENVATYARVRPYNPAINEDKRMTARCKDGNKILNQNGQMEDTYNFTRVFDMGDDTQNVFDNALRPLLDYKILQGINSIFIVYGQSGSGKSFTLIGEDGHLGVLPMSLKYLLDQEKVEGIKISTIECYGIKATKIGFYDLVELLEMQKTQKGLFDPYKSQDNPRLNSGTARTLDITHDNCLDVITKLQAVSHMAPTLKNPHSSRGHTVYFCRVKMVELEPVYFIAVDLAGSEGQTALGTKDEFVQGLQLAMSKGKLDLTQKQIQGFETMYKIRSLEAGCINNGLTQLQSIFGELIKKKIAKSQGLGLRKVLSSFISLNSAYAILFTMSASANNNKVTRATLNFAKQTQLVKVETKRAKKKIDKDKVIRELKEMIDQLTEEMKEKDKIIEELELAATKAGVDVDAVMNAVEAASGAGGGGAVGAGGPAGTSATASALAGLRFEDVDSDDEEAMKRTQRGDTIASETGLVRGHRALKSMSRSLHVFAQVDELSKQVAEEMEEDSRWQIKVEDNVVNVAVDLKALIGEEEMRRVFDEVDSDKSGVITSEEMHTALAAMGQDLSMDQVEKLVDEIDVNGDGQVDFEEFKVLFQQGWFIKSHENKLMESMKRMLETQTMLTASALNSAYNSDAEDSDDAAEDAEDDVDPDDLMFGEDRDDVDDMKDPQSEWADEKVGNNRKGAKKERDNKVIRAKDKIIESLQKQLQELTKELETTRGADANEADAGNGGVSAVAVSPADPSGTATTKYSKRGKGAKGARAVTASAAHATGGTGDAASLRQEMSQMREEYEQEVGELTKKLGDMEQSKCNLLKVAHEEIEKLRGIIRQFHSA